MFRPASIVNGDLGAFRLNEAVSVFVVPVAAPWATSFQLPLSAQFVLLAPVHCPPGTGVAKKAWDCPLMIPKPVIWPRLLTPFAC